MRTGGEPAVQLIQPCGTGRPSLAVGGISTRMAPHCLKKTFDLAASLRPVRQRMSDQDAQLRAGHGERLIDKGPRYRHRPAGKPGRDRALERRARCSESSLHPHRCPVTNQRSSRRRQVGLLPRSGTVQHIAGPQHVRRFSLEPPNTTDRAGCSHAREMPLQRALRRRIPGLATMIRRTCAASSPCSPLQRRRHRQHALRRHRLALAVAGQQGLDPPCAGPDPPVDGLQGDLHAPATRPGVHPAGDAATTLPRCFVVSPSSSAGPISRYRTTRRPAPWPAAAAAMLCRRHPRHLPW